MNEVVWVLIAFLAFAGVILYIRSTRRRRGTPEKRAKDDPGRRLAGVKRMFGAGFESVLGRSGVSESALQELEESLLAADLGIEAVDRIVEAVRRDRPADAGEARDVIRAEMLSLLEGMDRGLRLDGTPPVVVMVGVNGVGKTTTVAKLAARLQAEGHKPIIGAADTFRPAADTQLLVWAERVGVQVVTGQSGGDPAAVAFDTVEAARARGAGVVLIDTAGRFQTRHNLMQELSKILRVIGRGSDQPSEVLLVMDATTGQSGLAQARRFAELGVTGIILTKLDGTAKGGVVLGVERELSIPVKFIGVGEGLDDLAPFDSQTFLNALLSHE